METIKTPFFWIKKIEKALINLDRLPLFRLPKPCDWMALSTSLQEEFQLSHVTIIPSPLVWKTKEDCNMGLGDNPLALHFNMSPLDGHVSWIMGQEDIAKISSSFLVTPPHIQSLSSEILQEGFYRYLTLDVLHLLEKDNFFPNLSPKMTENIQEEEGFLCMDIHITVGQETMVGRLLFSSAFQKDWEEHYRNFEPASLQDLSKDTEIPLSLTGGATWLSYSEFKKIALGDFILLDQKKYDPATRKGIVTLQLGNLSLFHAKIKENRIKLLDYAFYYEENAMTEKFSDESFTEENEDVIPAEKIPSLEEKSAAIQDVPLLLTVEMARIQMTLQKLLELQPGNFLELGISPEQGVNLTINGKKIGRGELVYLGDALGIRVIELG
jgi:flagellar motor switch protein FliN/FliY